MIVRIWRAAQAILQSFDSTVVHTEVALKTG